MRWPTAEFGLSRNLPMLCGALLVRVLEGVGSPDWVIIPLAAVVTDFTGEDPAETCRRAAPRQIDQPTRQHHALATS